MRYGPRNQLAAAPSGTSGWDSLENDATNIVNYAVPIVGLGIIGLLTGGIGDALLGAGAGYLAAPNLPILEPSSANNAGGQASGTGDMTTVLLLGGLLAVALYAGKK